MIIAAARLSLALLSVLFIITSCKAADDPLLAPPKLLLISFDGFGWNFLSKLPSNELSNFEKFINGGVHVRWIQNIFPTVTRPNHMSMVSGLYAESHGIVANDFYDEDLRDAMPGAGQFSEKDSKWVDQGAEPIWVTNTKAGGDRLSGTIYWPCADAKIKGVRPNEILGGEWSVSEEKVSPEKRIDTALTWMTRPDKPLNFVAVYMNDPDETSHTYGPDSQEVLDSIRRRDKIVEYLLNKTKELHLENALNVIITADHGQQTIYPAQMINLDDYLDHSWYNVYPDVQTEQPMTNLWPQHNHYQDIVDAFKNKPHNNLHVETKLDSAELKALNYSTSSRIGPIVLYAEPGWVIGNSTTNFNHKGQHGWDPRFAPSMYPFFMARGPAFHTGIRDAAPFHIVDIYPLMCYVLGLIPSPNNGSLGNVEHIVNLRIEHKVPDSTGGSGSQPANYTAIGIGVLLLIVVVVVVVVIVRYVRQSRNVTASYKRSFARTGRGDELVADDEVVVFSDDEL